MSTIVVVKKGKKATIAADTLTTFGDLKFTNDYDAEKTKIIKYKNNYIGISGMAVHNLVLSQLLTSTKRNFSFKSKAEIFQSFLKYIVFLNLIIF